MQKYNPLELSTVEGLQSVPQVGAYARSTKVYTPRDIRQNRPRWEIAMSLTAVFGDFSMILLGFILAFWLRYQSGFISPYHGNGNDVPPVISEYWKLILFGVALVFGGILSKCSYEYKDLLSPRKSLIKIVLILSVCLFAFMGISLAFSTTPGISRVFVICAWIFIFMALVSWRLILFRALQFPALVLRLRKRLVVVGAGFDTMRIKEQLTGSSEFEFVGWIQGNKPNRSVELEQSRLGSIHELEDVFQSHDVDIAVLTESEALQLEGVVHVSKICEREHVEFKMVPHFFETLISGLRPSIIGGVSVLGVDSLHINRFENRAIKRFVDVLGASMGLLMATPVILGFGALVYLESPGPIFYKQVRTGRNGRLFSMYKIRSMKMDAEKNGKAGWTKENDPRRLKIGALMRKWNIDELPQFFNVLRGEMSLVGPRPERPELIHHFKYAIPHYQLRHTCCPGMSGWAQVNGWRGNTSLENRISYDIWYVENWSIILDFKVMFLTFFKQQNAY
jgi:exopolysaccharide biosynthesis polyprenyl glycosylphosphotransferase